MPGFWNDRGPRQKISTGYWMREAEIKHGTMHLFALDRRHPALGRIAMLAVVGYLATDAGLRLPGEKFAAVGSSITAHDAAVANGSMGSAD